MAILARSSDQAALIAFSLAAENVFRGGVQNGGSVGGSIDPMVFLDVSMGFMVIFHGIYGDFPWDLWWLNGI